MKKYKFKVIIAITLAVVFGIIGSICFSSYAKDKKVVDIYEFIMSSRKLYGISFTNFDTPDYYLEIDNLIKDVANDEEYLGYFSPKGAVTSSISKGRKSISTSTVIATGTLDVAEYTTKETDVSIAEDEFKAYTNGRELEYLEVGDKFTVTIPDVNGTRQIKCVKVGSCRTDTILYLAPNWEETYRAQMVIEGLNIDDYVANPYSVVAYACDTFPYDIRMEISKHCKISTLNGQGFSSELPKNHNIKLTLGIVFSGLAVSIILIMTIKKINQVKVLKLTSGEENDKTPKYL